LERLKETRVLIGCDWRQVFRDFYTFITMGLPYYDTNFCPTLLIDFMWHAVMVKGHITLDIPHCAKERTPEEDHRRHLYFCDVFKAVTGRNPYTGSGSTESIKNMDLYQVADQLRDLPGQIIEEERQKTERKQLERQMQAEEAQRRAADARRRQLEEQAQREALEAARRATLEAERVDLAKEFKTIITMSDYLRYKVISEHHPALDAYTCIIMATRRSHHCQLCDPPAPPPQRTGSTC
jgi:hypothetical protein